MSSNSSLDLKRAEQSYISLRKQKLRADGKRIAAKSNDQLILEALRVNTSQFFKKILSDTREEKLWNIFISGSVVLTDDQGNPMLDDKGNYIRVEPTAQSWLAFKQAVAYKRGTPAVNVEGATGKNEPIAFTFNILGAGQDFFSAQARLAGLIDSNDKVIDANPVKESEEKQPEKV